MSGLRIKDCILVEEDVPFFLPPLQLHMDLGDVKLQLPYRLPLALHQHHQGSKERTWIVQRSRLAGHAPIRGRFRVHQLVERDALAVVPFACHRTLANEEVLERLLLRLWSQCRDHSKW